VKSLAPQDYGTAPAIVTEPGGRATVLWVKSSSFYEETVVASTHAPGGVWSEPINVADKGLQLSVPSESPIAVTRQGESIAVWVTESSSEKKTSIESSTRRRGQHWSDPAKISTSPVGPFYGDPGLQLALAPDGEAIAVWRCFDGSRWVTEAATRPAGSES